MYTVPAAACSMAVLYICTSCCMFHDSPISVPAAACSTTVFYVCTSCYMFQGCSLYLYQLLHVPGLFSLTVPAAACSMTVLYICTSCGMFHNCSVCLYSVLYMTNNNNNNNNKNIYLPPKHTVLQVWFFTIFLRYLTAD